MRRFLSGLLAAALALGLWGAAPAQAKVYKMNPEERTAALKEKKAKKSQAKKAGKAAPGQDQGGWVEVKPGEKVAKKNKKSTKLDEAAKAAEERSKKGKKAKKEPAEGEAKAAKGKPAAEPVAEKKPAKSAKSEKKAGRKSATQGDRLVGKDYSGGKISGTSTEVRRQGDDLSGYSVSRPGQDKAPEVRQEAQPGPVESSKPVGTEHKTGEGRF